jgi:hypothetical protein
MVSQLEHCMDIPRGQKTKVEFINSSPKASGSLSSEDSLLYLRVLLQSVIDSDSPNLHRDCEMLFAVPPKYHLMEHPAFFLSSAYLRIWHGPHNAGYINYTSLTNPHEAMAPIYFRMKRWQKVGCYYRNGICCQSLRKPEGVGTSTYCSKRRESEAGVWFHN